MSRLLPRCPGRPGLAGPVDSNVDEAYRHSEDGVLSLLWRDGDVVGLLETESVSLEELLRIAESASLVPAAPR